MANDRAIVREEGTYEIWRECLEAFEGPYRMEACEFEFAFASHSL